MSSTGPLRIKKDQVEIMFILLTRSPDIGSSETVLLNNSHVIQVGDGRPDMASHLPRCTSTNCAAELLDLSSGHCLLAPALRQGPAPVSNKARA